MADRRPHNSRKHQPELGLSSREERRTTQTYRKLRRLDWPDLADVRRAPDDFMMERPNIGIDPDERDS